jgi:hypothetical protein
MSMRGVAVAESESSSGLQVFIRPPGLVDRKLVEMERELKAMAGSAVLIELNDLDSSVRVFVDNYPELNAFVVNVQTDPGNAFLGLDQARKRQAEDVFAETHRLVHNFLASSFSLVDHTRCTRDRITPGLVDVYKAEAARRFSSDGIAQFWQGLRNYQTHYRPPQLSIVGRGLPPNSTLSLVMKRKDLRGWKNWPPVARTWLRETDDDIVLIDIATDYFHKVRDFQLWFGDQMRRERHSDLAAFYQRQDEYFLFYIESRLDTWLADPGSGPLGDRGLFLHIFDLSDFETLDSLPPGSSERTEATLAILRSHFQVPSALARKFARAYSDRRFFRP